MQRSRAGLASLVHSVVLLGSVDANSKRNEVFLRPDIGIKHFERGALDARSKGFAIVWRPEIGFLIRFLWDYLE